MPLAYRRPPQPGRPPNERGVRLIVMLLWTVLMMLLLMLFTRHPHLLR